MRRTRSLTIMLAISASLCATAKPAGSLTGTSAFQAAFQGSFYGFDICGDVPDGQLYRKALAKKVAHCPFTADAKAGYTAWAADAEARMTADVKRYIAEHDKLPERLDQRRVACRTEKDTPGYQKTAAALAAYAHGGGSFDAVVPDACDAKAGAR